MRTILTAILFNVHVDADGTLMTDGETICKDGKYVFDAKQPRNLHHQQQENHQITTKSQWKQQDKIA